MSELFQGVRPRSTSKVRSSFVTGKPPGCMALIILKKCA